jgi:hypothetical protein
VLLCLRCQQEALGNVSFMVADVTKLQVSRLQHSVLSNLQCQ